MLIKALTSARLLGEIWRQRRVAYLPASKLEAIQRQRVREIVTHAYESVPFYRSAMDEQGLKPADFQSGDDLAHLPLISKEQLRTQPEQFLSSAVDRSRCVYLKTGGSTGLQAAIPFNPEALLLGLACAGRESEPITSSIRMHPLSTRVLALISPHGSTNVLQTFYRSRAHVPVHRGELSIFDPVEQNVAVVNTVQPDILASYGSYLGLLFRLHFEGAIRLHRPRAIVYGGDHFPEPLLTRVQEELGVPVFACYGASEVPRIGFSCEQRQGLHVHADLCHVRLLGDGSEGELITSNLTNRAMVLLNYRIGDLGSRSTGTCDCGRGLPMLDALIGRSEEVIWLSGGRFVHPYNFHNVFQYRRDVLDYQVIQHDVGEFSLRVILRPDSSFAEAERELTEECLRLLGASAQIRVEAVSEIPRLANGKTRRVCALASR